MNTVWKRLMPLAAAAALLLGPGPARAEDYVLGPEDVVSVSVWMHPELEKVYTVSADGNITVPPVGDVKAAGLTARQLGDRLGEKLSAYLRQTTTATVTVTQFLSHSVYVSGAVAKPGRYGFERIPTILDVLGQAGGALPLADLSSVQVLRREGDARRTLTADLAAALRSGDASGLPALKPGDTVVVPGAAAQGGGAATSEGVGVLGEVAKPGMYSVGAGQDIWAVLAAAGGVTANGNLKDVRVLSRSEGGQTVATLNLRDALDHGSRAPATVKSGDVVVVMRRGLTAWNGLTNVLGLTQNAVNIVVLLDYFQNRNNNK